MATSIQKYTPDDEIEDWYLNQGGRITHIIQGNHDEHGWSGMEAIRDTINLLAAAAGWEIKDVIVEPEETK